MAVLNLCIYEVLKFTCFNVIYTCFVEIFICSNHKFLILPLFSQPLFSWCLFLKATFGVWFCTALLQQSHFPSGTMKCFNTLTWMQPVPPVNKMTWITRTVSEPSWTEKWRDHFWKWFSSVCSPKTFAHLDELCGERHYTDICSWFRRAHTESWREGRGRDVSQTYYMKWKGRSL